MAINTQVTCDVCNEPISPLALGPVIDDMLVPLKQLSVSPIRARCHGQYFAPKGEPWPPTLDILANKALETARVDLCWDCFDRYRSEE